MKCQIEIDEKEFGFICKKEDVGPLFQALCEVYGLIWTEAKYDPYNEQTKQFAEKVLPHIQLANKIMKFKK